MGVPLAAIRFEAPLRTFRGRHARGGDYLHQRTLRELLTWPVADNRPDLAVVLIDHDADQGRKARLVETTTDLFVSRVIAVAIQEFEAWLIADIAAVATAIRGNFPDPGSPENLSPGRAKELLANACATHPDGIDRKAIRIQIANTCDLATVERRCSAFVDFGRDIANLPGIRQ